MPDSKKSVGGLHLSDKRSEFWVVESVKDERFEDAYEIETELSNDGPFGRLLKCRPRGIKKQCSVKILPKSKDKRVSPRGASHLMKLNHENLARVIEVFETYDSIYIVSDYLSGGEVLEKACKKLQFTEREAVKILREVLKGLAYIHDEQLVHGNLKPSNLIYINESEESLIKITDVALFKLLDKDLLRHFVSEAVQFCAPEVIRSDVGNMASDMWSFGCIAYLLLCGVEPFQADSQQETYKKIFKAAYNTESDSYANLSTSAKDFLMRLLIVDPSKRLTAKQALNNQWIQGKTAKIDHLESAIDNLRVIVNKKRAKAFLNDKSFFQPQDGHQSLCQKHLPKDCWAWLQKPCTSYGSSLVDCIKSALENPDSLCGLYAPDPECYDQFAEIFMPVIADYHKLDIHHIKDSVHDYGDPAQLADFELKYAEAIESTRIRTSRTIEGFPMGPKLTRQTREQIRNKALEAFHNFGGDLYGEYTELAELSYEEREKLIKGDYLYSDGDNKYLESANAYKDWPLNRGIFMNRNKTLLVWVNEEDHLKIISLQKGSQMKSVYARLIKALAQLEKSLTFVKHQKYGYLTFSPTNIGTSLKVSAFVKLPKLTALYATSTTASGASTTTSTLLNNPKLKQLADSMGLVIGPPSAEGVCEISNKIVFGKTEFDIVSSTWNGVKRILEEEFQIK